MLRKHYSKLIVIVHYMIRRFRKTNESVSGKYIDKGLACKLLDKNMVLNVLVNVMKLTRKYRRIHIMVHMVHADKSNIYETFIFINFEAILFLSTQFH